MKEFITYYLLFTAFICYVRGYVVDGNTILDSNGNPVLLRGLDRPSLEWNPVGENLSPADYGTMHTTWNPNTIRLSLNQCFWLTNDTGYQTTVHTQVTEILALNIAVILDLHWSNPSGYSSGQTCGQQTGPDTYSIQFWTQVASVSTYQNNPNVLFELYNEPHDISWAAWQSAFQGLVDAVRGAGANNIVIIGGLNYAYDLSQVLSYPISDSQNSIVYNTHPYQNSGKEEAQWYASFGYLAATFPVIATEFGTQNACNATYYTDFINFANQYCISFTAWAWYVKNDGVDGCTFPAVIDNYDGTPNADGVPVKASLLGDSRVPLCSRTTTGVFSSGSSTSGSGSVGSTSASTSGSTSTSTSTSGSTVSSGSGSGSGGITVIVNSGTSVWWLGINSFSGANEATSTVYYKDSSPDANWIELTTEDWGWDYDVTSPLVVPVSLELTSGSETVITLINVITSVNGGGSYTSSVNYP